MHGVKSVAAVALLGLASAAPASQPSGLPQGGSFKVNNVPTGNVYTRNGKVALERALNKHGLPFPEDWVTTTFLPSSSSSSSSNNKASSGNNGGGNVQATGQNSGSTAGGGNESGEVAANSIKNDVEYTAQISVGGQLMNMDFDTGSSDLWLMNTQMPASESQGHTLYDPSKSNTFKQMQGATFSVSYGDKSFAKGSTVGTDTVNIGGAQVQNQVIELPDQVGDEFTTDTSSNGLVGLAFGKLNTVKPTAAKTFFENVQGQLAQPVFTANLKHAATGAYEFGKIDSTQFTGQMTWVPVDTASGFWQFPSTQFQVGNGPLLQNTAASPAIADTGTSLILMDPQVAQSYYSQVQGSSLDQVHGGYVVPSNAQLPDLHLQVGSNGGKITVPGNLLSYTPVNSTHNFGGLQSNQNGGTQIMGDIMFKSQFVAFDIGKGQLGFANHAN